MKDMSYRDRVEEKIDAELRVNRIMPRLTDKQVIVANMIMLSYTIQEIADHLECSKSSVYYTIKRMKSKAGDVTPLKQKYLGRMNR
ncbi:hypothetical protein LCGC14_1214050 [marine sediment metagenome]|uniref:HTH luxR-type domain-containing protein n=1 Tax=marine sediment metagenome TaxID=412755 RepID=A0A0F9NVH7_9ZZZZ